MANGQQEAQGQAPQPQRRRRRRRAQNIPVQTRVPKNGGRRRGRNPNRSPPGRRRRARARVTRDIVKSEVSRLGLTGPAPTIVQRATATLGSVQPNNSGNLELEFQMCLNPTLVKESTGSNQFGPIQISASTYSLWKLRSAIFHFQPLVGSSAVSGTVYRISLNLSGSPGSNSWSALGARYHLDVTPGQARKFHVPKKMLQGTKEGWFMTDPKADPTNSLGGSIEVHSLGKTMSTYQAQAFTGDLFLLEMTATWEFTNYNAQPGLLSMVKDTHESKMEVTSEGNGSPLVMEVPINSKLSNYTGGSTHADSASGTLGETIWSVVDTGVETLSGTVPPPFGWLVKGGWWFVRRILGKKLNSSNEEVAQFYVYQTLSDAQNDNRCITTSATTATATAGEYEIQQITPGNVGLNDTTTAVLSIQPATTFDVTQPFYFRSNYIQVARPAFISSSEFMVNLYGPQNFQQLPKLNFTNEPDPGFWSVAILDNPIFTQNRKEIFPSTSDFSNTVPIYQRSADQMTLILQAYAYASYQVSASGATMRFVHLLAHVEEELLLQWSTTGSDVQHVVLAPQWDSTRPPTLSSSFYVHGEQNLSATFSGLLPAGSWVLFTTVGTATTGFRYGIPFGLANFPADLPSEYTHVSSIPSGTPFNPSPDGVMLSAIPQSTRQISQISWDDEYSSSTDDDEEWDGKCHIPPDPILYDFTKEAAAIYKDLLDRNIPKSKAAMVAQECSPSDSYEAFQYHYEGLLVDGLLPSTSRSCAFKRSKSLISRGHAE